jgi:hypothetical protein
MADWLAFDSPLERTDDGQAYVPLPLLREPYHGTDWARALVDLAGAVEEGRPHSMGAEHAAHVVEVLEAARTSCTQSRPVELSSDFPRPEPLDWAR